MSTIRRPGPLRDLPLEQFLTEQPPTPTRPNKRPLSPSAPNLFSPAKRRILTQEGIFSPEKSVKSPLSSSRSGRFAPSHFQDLLAGPASPARRLDFGSPSSCPSDLAASSSQLFTDLFADPVNTTPPRVASAPSPNLQPSPEFPFQTIDEPVGKCSDLASDSDSDFLGALWALPLQYIHYPGFDVWHDPDVEDASTIPPRDVAESSSSLYTNNSKDEEDKENLTLRKKPRKSPGASHELLKGVLLSLDAPGRGVWRSGGARSVPMTPAFSQSREESTTPTATRLTGLALTPRKPTNIDKEELKRRRTMLASEVEGDDDEDEDEL